MKRILKAVEPHSKRLVYDESGSVTVESVLWVPVYLLFFGLIADVSFMFHGQAKAMRIAYDGNRQASFGLLKSETAVEDMVLTRVHAFSPQATVDTAFGTDSITTTLTMPASDLMAIGSFSRIFYFNVTVTSVHKREV